MGSNALVEGICIGTIREADFYVNVFEPKARVDVRGDFVVSLQDIFDIDVNEVIEGVDMLFYKSFDFQESRQ